MKIQNMSLRIFTVASMLGQTPDLACGPAAVDLPSFSSHSLSRLHPQVDNQT